MRVNFSKRFSKKYNKAPLQVRHAFDSRLNIFILDKFNPVLNNHTLTGKYAGCRSINVTGDWRAIFQELENRSIVYFATMDTHSNLYR